MRVIGLTGKKYVGKDTAALALVEQGWVRIAFADALREMLYDLDPILHVGHDGYVYRWREVWDTEGYDVLKTMPEGRRLMQVFGTDVIRTRDPDFWAHRVESRMLAEQHQNYVITDVRFDNEARMIRKYGDVVRIVRDTSSFDTCGAEHISEAGISSALVDANVYNAGSVTQLHDALLAFVGIGGGVGLRG